MARSGDLPAPAEERLIAGRYRIESLLGKGGMGAVYAALDTSTGARVAVKRTFGAASPKVRELFRREFHTLHGLRHPNIIEVYDYGSDEDGLFYTMELLQGGDLGSAAPLPWRQVCSYLRQVAALLGLLHARRLLHRDISPRNLWLLPDGRLKLIDFGALCPFGVPTEVVGTPPFIAPEWLYEPSAGVSVDQRADLYALGALAYWLLTTAHAYPARSMHELPRIWAREPAAPSSLAALIEHRALEPIPTELDVLVASLLRRDPAARPASTEALIARIDAIAGPVAEPADHAVRGYVRSKAFVGRSAQLLLFQRELSLERASGKAFVVEAAPGMGRSRFLEELSVRGRLADAATVSVGSGGHERTFGVANSIALRLLESLPNDALAAASPYLTELSQLSPELARRLGVAFARPRELTPRGREQLQQALTAWLLALAERRTLLLLIDDLQASDEESAAWLAALARSCGQRPLLLVAAVAREPSSPPSLLVQMFCSAALRVELEPLSATEMYELLHSVFGPAAYLARVSETLHRVSQGNPAHCLELVEQLIERSLARFSEGTWTLPGQLAEESLPGSRSEMHSVRLARLGESARRLAESLSIHDGRLTRVESLTLAESGAAEAEAALVELTLSGVLIESDQGYGFAHDSVRERLFEELATERRTAAHAKLGAALLSHAADPIDRLRAALHLLRAGDFLRAEPLVLSAVMHLFEGHRARMQIATPMLEQAVALYRAAGRGPELLAPPLAALAAASFFVDRRLSDRHGIPAVETLEQLLCFDLARKLRRFLGPKLALGAALATANVRLRRRRGPGVPSVTETLRMLFGSVVGLNAVATSSFDVAKTERCRLALAPIEAFGEDDVAGFVRSCTLAVAALLTEDYSATLRELRRLAVRMESGQPIRKLPEHLRQEFLAGCLFSIGLLESWRQSPAALEIAARIEPYSPLAALNADHLRATYYSGRGEIERATHYRERVETRALQLGAAWQVVTLGPIEEHVISLWIQDALVAKRAATELDRLSRDLPSMRREARRARATYLVLCGRYREAIEVMQSDDSPRTLAGWSRTQGILARAHNRLGEHARARELCVQALAGRSDDDLDFVVMNLHVQLELVLANAALGDLSSARDQSDRLLVRHQALGPVFIGALHEVRARVALIERDFERAREHGAAVRRCYAPTQIQSLLELTNQLDEAVRRAERGEVGHGASATALLGDDAHLNTRLRLLLTNTEASVERRCQRILQIAFDLTGAADGYVVSGIDGVVHAGDEPPSDELVRWSEQQLSAAEVDQTLLVTDEPLRDTAIFVRGSLQYCAIPLPSEKGGPVSAIVLGFSGEKPRALSQQVLDVLAAHLK